MISNQDILNWVDAHDIREELTGFSSNVQEAARQQESADRALLVDTAIRVPLYDELEVVNSSLGRLLQQRKILSEVLGEPIAQTREEMIIPRSDKLISPVGLITKGITSVSVYEKSVRTQAEWSRYQDFKVKIRAMEGGYLKPTAMARLAGFLLQRKFYSSREEEALRGIIEFSEEGISFLSPDPNDYRSALKKVPGIGETVTEGLIRLLQNMTPDSQT